jgi:glutamate-1-semialdehyde 2,1-aminomutase
MDRGVPESVKELTQKLEFNNFSDLELLFAKMGDSIAALVIEPMNARYPLVGFLERIRELCTKHGVVLVFDETITGFRFDKGGAQRLFNVKPDLSTFGKGMANGYPISAIVGRREIMAEMETIFYSGTFGGELLSLAATSKVLDMHLDDEICPRLGEIGNQLSLGLEKIVSSFNLENFISLSGHSSWKFLNWHSAGQEDIQTLKTYFQQVCLENGLLVLGTHNVTTSFNDKIIKETLTKYHNVLAEFSETITNGNLEKKLKVPPMQPLFKVR